jgi:DNA-binding Xre family transcriptional regulator
MKRTPIQINLERLMLKKGFNMKSLSLAAKLNETAVRDILKGRVQSPSFHTLERLAETLNCEVYDITYGSNNPYKNRANPKLNAELLGRVIKKVDKLLDEQHIKLPVEERSRIYSAWYELKVLNDTEEDDKKDEAQINTLIQLTAKM